MYTAEKQYIIHSKFVQTGKMWAIILEAFENRYDLPQPCPVGHFHCSLTREQYNAQKPTSVGLSQQLHGFCAT